MCGFCILVSMFACVCDSLRSLRKHGSCHWMCVCARLCEWHRSGTLANVSVYRFFAFEACSTYWTFVSNFSSYLDTSRIHCTVHVWYSQNELPTLHWTVTFNGQMFVYGCGYFGFLSGSNNWIICVRTTIQCMTVPHKHTDNHTIIIIVVVIIAAVLCMSACPMKCQTFAFYQLLLSMSTKCITHSNSAYIFQLTQIQFIHFKRIDPLLASFTVAYKSVM